MKKELKKVRKFKGEAYSFYLVTPSFKGEKGCCGIELAPYVEVVTPENGLGYPDYILFNGKGEGYTLYRYCPSWIIRECEKVQAKIMEAVTC